MRPLLLVQGILTLAAVREMSIEFAVS